MEESEYMPKVSWPNPTYTLIVMLLGFKEYTRQKVPELDFIKIKPY